jgi:hypothetical protein
MSKPKTDAKPKGGKRHKRQEPATKAERFKWDPGYCQRVEKLGKDGMSAVEIRVELGIPGSTWRLWLQTHPAFAEAVEEADDTARAYMEKVGRLGVKMGSGMTATAYIFLMKNRWPKIYRDRQDHQITGANDGPVVTELRAPDLSSIADPREALKQFEPFRSSLALAAPVQTKH